MLCELHTVYKIIHCIHCVILHRGSQIIIHYTVKGQFFAFNLEKITPGWKNLHRHRLWCLWQIWGMVQQGSCDHGGKIIQRARCVGCRWLNRRGLFRYQHGWNVQISPGDVITLSWPWCHSNIHIVMSWRCCSYILNLCHFSKIDHVGGNYAFIYVSLQDGCKNSKIQQSIGQNLE